MPSNRIEEFEQDICSILAQLSHFIHPEIIHRVQARNKEESNYFGDLFSDKIDVTNYLFEGSACVFPGVRRYESGKGQRKKYNAEFSAIIDDNTFPRHLWCYLENGKGYSGPNWKATNLSEFELAHIFSHKARELEFESAYFDDVDQELVPYGEFTCVCNVILLPKGTVRPTDNSKAIKSAFYKRYIDLYGEEPLNGRKGFRHELVPDWYNSLTWIEPQLPPNWEDNLERLLKYRTKRITHLLNTA